MTGKLSQPLPAWHCAAGSWDRLQLAEDTPALFPPDPLLLAGHGFLGRLACSFAALPGRKASSSAWERGNPASAMSQGAGGQLRGVRVVPASALPCSAPQGCLADWAGSWHCSISLLADLPPRSTDVQCARPAGLGQEEMPPRSCLRLQSLRGCFAAALLFLFWSQGK